MPRTGPRPHARGSRPHLWKTGPDQELHLRYRAFVQQRNQAQWRGEIWHLTFDQWLALWANQYHLRGRRQMSLCLTRRDYNQPWTLENAEVVTRQEHNQRQFEHGRRGRRTRAEIERDRAAGIERKPGRRLPV